jgi:hypothetical protein
LVSTVQPASVARDRVEFVGIREGLGRSVVARPTFAIVLRCPLGYGPQSTFGETQLLPSTFPSGSSHLELAIRMFLAKTSLPASPI